MVLIPSQRDPLCPPLLYKVSSHEIVYLGKRENRIVMLGKTLGPTSFSQLQL